MIHPGMRVFVLVAGLGLLFGPAVVPVPHFEYLGIAWGIYGALFVAWLCMENVKDSQRRLERQRADFGLCMGCGYDVRAANDFCPECGTRVPRGDRAGEQRS